MSPFKGESDVPGQLESFISDHQQVHPVRQSLLRSSSSLNPRNPAPRLFLSRLSLSPEQETRRNVARSSQGSTRTSRLAACAARDVAISHRPVSSRSLEALHVADTLGRAHRTSSTGSRLQAGTASLSSPRTADPLGEAAVRAGMGADPATARRRAATVEEATGTSRDLRALPDFRLTSLARAAATTPNLPPTIRLPHPRPTARPTRTLLRSVRATPTPCSP